MPEDLEIIDGEAVLNVSDLTLFQDAKPCPMRRYSGFLPPGEFASRVGRTIALHVQRLDWRQARHSLDAAQRECEDFQRTAVASRQKSIEERAAETSIAQLRELGERERNALARHDIDTVADLMLATDDELQRIPDIGRVITTRIREAIANAGFELNPLLRD